MISIHPMHTLHTLLISGLLFLLITAPALVAGTVTPGSSYHTINIGYPNIITPEISWQKCIKGPFTNSSFIIRQSSDGGYNVVGKTESDETDADLNYWMVKLNPGGDIGWPKNLRETPQKNPLTPQQTDTCGFIGFGGFG